MKIFLSFSKNSCPIVPKKNLEFEYFRWVSNILVLNIPVRIWNFFNFRIVFDKIFFCYWWYILLEEKEEKDFVITCSLK